MLVIEDNDGNVDLIPYGHIRSLRPGQKDNDSDAFKNLRKAYSGRAMKHRGKSSKLKYEHALIEGLRPLLESIAPWEEIHSIIPGRIRPTKSSRRQIRLEIKYSTVTGLKALAKTGTAVQEVFFVTANPEAVRERLLETATGSGVDV